MTSISDLAVGQKIRLSDSRTGTIRFVGHTAFAQGDWVGIELDDGSGKNDGSVQGERYFDCPMGYGMFVRPTTITVLAQPAPPPPKPAPAPAKKITRPNTMFAAGGARAPNPADTSLARRQSLNAPSPTPAARPSRPSSTARVGRALFLRAEGHQLT
jgi:dynactin 1